MAKFSFTVEVETNRKANVPPAIFDQRVEVTLTNRAFGPVPKLYLTDYQSDLMSFITGAIAHGMDMSVVAAKQQMTPYFRLSQLQQAEIREYLHDNHMADAPDELSEGQCLDYWLRWHGIHGFTNQIKDVALRIYLK